MGLCTFKTPYHRQHNSDHTYFLMNQNNHKPQQKKAASSIDKKERRLLWKQLAVYCTALLEESKHNDYKPGHKFEHPEPMIQIFIKLGLRPPNNTKGLDKFYDNFIKRCNFLPENEQKKKKKWQNGNNRKQHQNQK